MESNAPALYGTEDTIAAISTPPGEGAIGIVRLSGNLALPILRQIFRTPDDYARETFTSHRMHFGRIVDGEGRVLDEVLAVFMSAPKTYTREDVAEIHCHGGTAALRNVLETVIRAGARPAEPGEFTLRAFLNGRLDLTQAEAVIDVIHSRTRQSLVSAASQLGGGLGRRIGELRERLVHLLAHVEAFIDFPEDDIPEADIGAFQSSARSFGTDIDRLLATHHCGRILREGASVAIVGRPNVGKSSLLNALLAEERAIVTDVPGTTRDTIEEAISLDGLPIRLIDTAGIRESRDLAESEGVRRSMKAMEHADVVMLVLDGSVGLHPADGNLLASLTGRSALVVLNKMDLPVVVDRSELPAGIPVLDISAKTERGIPELLKTLRNLILQDSATTEGVLITRLRHKTALEAAAAGINGFLTDLERQEPPEILAFDLREALDGLDRILGITTADDVLQVIFSDFCIGK